MGSLAPRDPAKPETPRAGPKATLVHGPLRPDPPSAEWWPQPHPAHHPPIADSEHRPGQLPAVRGGPSRCQVIGPVPAGDPVPEPELRAPPRVAGTRG